MTTAEDLQQAVDEVFSAGVGRGLLHNVAEDSALDGRTVTVHGRTLVNFGSCSYLGLEMHPALRAGVVDAVARYGTQFSSSRTYISAPAYAEVEETLSALFGRPTIVAPSTTLGHVAAVPVVVGSRDALLMDHQLHHSVQTAAKLAGLQGSTLELLPHSDMDALEERVRALGPSHRRIWYAVDGLYSMYADFAPLDAVNELMERHEQLWLYVDDSHAMSWTGREGRGFALERLSAAARERAVVSGSLNKSFAAAGGAFTFPDDELRRRVFTLGGPLIFSGPVQPPMLGALLASAKLHRTDEVVQRQGRVLDLIRLFNRLTMEAGLPLVSTSEAPIRCVGAGTPDIAYDLTARLREAGFFTDTASFPAVAAKRSGIRVTITAHQTDDDVARLVDALALQLPAALADRGSSPELLERAFAKQLSGRPVRLDTAGGTRTASSVPAQRSALRLQRTRSIRELDRDEWDAMLGGRGAFTWDALCTFESCFTGEVAHAGRREDAWDFSYWVVRDVSGRPVAATFFTTGLWKDDMLSTEAVSREVERLREADPYYLTSTVVGMGSLLSEGDHLYLDRSGDWRGALRLILQAARDEEDRAGAAAVVLRDLPDGDEELHAFLLGEGFARIPIFDTWVREIDFHDDEGFLAGLGKKARYHQRTRVLPWEERYAVAVTPSDSPEAATLRPEALDHLYRLYRNVHARNLELNVFPLPRRVLDRCLATPGWELVTLRLVDGPAEPVAFAMQHVGGNHVQPLFVGLHYAYVPSHHTYQQLLFQAIRSAQRRGAGQVLYGMSAGLQKARFGAVREQRWAYVQASDTYHADLLSRLTEGVLAG